MANETKREGAELLAEIAAEHGIVGRDRLINHLEHAVRSDWLRSEAPWFMRIMERSLEELQQPSSLSAAVEHLSGCLKGKCQICKLERLAVDVTGRLIHGMHNHGFIEMECACGSALSAAVETLHRALETVSYDEMYRLVESALQQLQGVPAEREP